LGRLIGVISTHIHITGNCTLLLCWRRTLEIPLLSGTSLQVPLLFQAYLLRASLLTRHSTPYLLLIVLLKMGPRGWYW
jgi:hypothetical protein